jgi:V-type H+-transporting ATPase subunit a
VFIVVYPGGDNDFLKTKLLRICDSFGAAKYIYFTYFSRFFLPEDPNTIYQKANEAAGELDELKSLVALTHEKIRELLLKYASVIKPVKMIIINYPIVRMLIARDVQATRY